MTNRKIASLLLTAICASAPYLYGAAGSDCVTQKDCFHGFGYHNQPDQECRGESPEPGSIEDGEAVWLAGSFPCGTIRDHFGWNDTHVPCGGNAIVTECA